MKKIVKLTEADLTRIVKRVIREQPIHTDEYMDELERIYRLRDDRLFHVEGADRKTANQLLKNFLRVSKGKARFISFTDCGYLDFSNVDFCQYPDLVYISLKGTPNNFEETQGDCYEQVGDGYAFNR
jgi:hypothetical protein